ncbi:MAG: DUF4906 domain-containing protein [Bacteroidales bacterium]|nr:DUF4906 domain-containing protein [Bacteroidales bacterium]
MRYLYNILAVSLLALLVSCEKHEQIGGYGNDGKVKITLKCAQMESVGGTKSLNPGNLPDEGTGTDYKVKDYWVLQYTSGGVYIDKSAKYVEVSAEEETKTPAIMPLEGEYYYCLFIANTHNPELDKDFEDFKGSLSEMTGFYKSISSLEETYNVTDNDLIMSGVAKLEYGATELKCFLYRNIAKVTVTLKNNQYSDLTIKSINIKNVPGGSLYADALVKVTSLPGINPATTPFPDSYTLPYFDYELDDISVAAGETKDFVWYLPRNMKGTVDGITSADQKNSKAPELATYIEVFATTSSGELFRYRFYMGANATTDFNVEPNKHYKLPITFVDKGTVVDSRVNDFSGITLSGKSNSYIINPLPVDAQSIYQLPITKVNQFWSSPDAPAGVDNTIGESTQWVAEVIWQDQPQRIINFKGADANSFTATGINPIQFEVLKGAQGNVIVGIKKAGETNYLWSWHLWITDYNPDDCKTPWVADKYVYFVPGGQVHRYAGEFWETNYQNRYIMDRNLGALSADRSDNIEKTGGFLYQFGRKDPLPFTNVADDGSTTDYENVKLYDIAGNPVKFSDNVDNPILVVNRQVEIYESVYQPYCFYYSGVDWAKNNRYSSYSYVWNGLVPNEKSMFDPCPEGWMVPKTGVWDIFGERGSSSVNKNENTTRYNQKDAGVEFYIDAPKDSEHKKYNFAYFPAMGIRHATGGYSNNYKTRGYLHTTQAATSNSRIDRWGFALFESGNAVSIVRVEESVSKYATRTHALNVRCVREKDITAGNEEENNNNNEEYNQVPW